jgi:zinc/manganese transport system permease protein
MIEILGFLAAPFAVCVVIVALHSYLGLHVLLRGVIFVDLALAQMAALGSVVALVNGHTHGSAASFAFSLAATTLGAVIFSFSRVREGRVPQEAIIGITFVVASAATLLVADRAPEGAEQLKELLAGSVLWASWPAVWKLIWVYAVIALLHLVFRHRFIAISEDPEGAFGSGAHVRSWDFLFYLLFGFAITLSVEIAGVLMVFAYLVAPAIIALACSRRWVARIAIGLAVGIVASAAGLLASYRWDLPSGPAVVCTLGLLLALFVPARRWFCR